MSTQKIEMPPEAIMHEASNLTPAELDLLPFGAIHVNPDGIIDAYNVAEEQLASRSREQVMGKRFFDDVAPCTRVQSFYGAFQEGIRRGQLNEVFDFTFRFPRGTREVRIRMIYSDAPRPGVWIFVTPLQATAM